MLPLNVRRDLYEHDWVERLCNEAYDAGKAHIEEQIPEIIKLKNLVEQKEPNETLRARFS